MQNYDIFDDAARCIIGGQLRFMRGRDGTWLRWWIGTNGKAFAVTPYETLYDESNSRMVRIAVLDETIATNNHKKSPGEYKSSIAKEKHVRIARQKEK